MSQVQLVLVVHNHQPVGNFDEVFAAAYGNAYLPFLRMLADYPAVKLGLHTSGCLWEWLEANRPEYGRLVGELLARGQLELLGGGMYEPILPILPRRDALWQLNYMNQFLVERFSFKPRGMWCPERVWEPHLPEQIAAAGLEYTLLDDYHFRGAALPEQVARQYFMTEHAGHTVALLPIARKLRYTIPFKPAADTLDYLRGLAQAEDSQPLVVFGDDGEKFGVWPDTHEWVYERGWLREFLTSLTANLDWIELLLPGEMLDRRRPAGKVFVPCTSYQEMGEWSRVDPDATADDPPGFWRNYLHKYPEANAMYRRMLFVSELLEQARGQQADPRLLAGAAEELGRAQCNCAYWHGIFGGLYLNYLRQAVSYHLAAAEQQLLDGCEGLAAPAVAELDHDGLGWPQQLLRSTEVTAIADGGRGLCLSRLDYRPTRYCWTDVLARRREAYHAKVLAGRQQAVGEHESIHDRVVLKEEGLARRLVFDPHQRVSFTTYFSDLESPQRLMEQTAHEEPPGFRFADYDVPANSISLGDGSVSGVVDHGTFRLSKSLRLSDSALAMSLRLEDGAPPAADGDFYVEFNLTLLSDRADDRYIRCGRRRHPVGEPGAWQGCGTIRLIDGWQRRELRLQAGKPKRILYYPVYTVSSSEGGFERTYQGSCIMLGYEPQALSGGIRIQLTIGPTRGAPGGK